MSIYSNKKSRRVAPEADDVLRYVTYDPESGKCKWVVDPGSRRFAGKDAGSPDPKGYLRIRFAYRTVLVHRLAWRVVHGEWPTLLIDHINGDKGDNRICNLRLATHQQNQANRQRTKGRDLPLGVRRTPSNTYEANLMVNGKRNYLGTFKTLEEATAARASLAIGMFGEYARTE